MSEPDDLFSDDEPDAYAAEEAERAADRAHLEELFAVGDDAIDAGFSVLVAAVWVKDDGTLAKAPLHMRGHIEAHRDKQLIRQQLVTPPHASLRVPDEYEVVVGFVPGAGDCVVLDGDVKGGKAGRTSMVQLEKDHGHFVEAAWCSPSGGVNVLLRKPPGERYGNRTPEGWDGIDVRGDAGWVVAPGCRCVGGAWEWKVGGFSTPAPLPETMAKELQPATEHGVRASNAETSAFIEASPEESSPLAIQAFTVELDRFRGAKDRGDSRHDALKRIVGWCCGMTALDLRWAWKEITTVWLALTPGERRDGEPGDLFAWTVGQERTKRVVQPAEVKDENGYDPIDLGPYLRGQVVRVTPDLVRMTNGQALLYRGRLNGIHGDSTAGKSWLTAFLAREVLADGQAVMIVDLEEPTPVSLIERLRQIGVSDQAIERQAVFIHPIEEFNEANVGRLIEHIRERGVVLVVIETLGEAFSLEGLNEDKEVEVAPWIRRVCRRIIDQTGVGMLLVDHGTKSAEKPLDPSGSKRKRAAINGSAWLMRSAVPFDRKDGGWSELVCAKDRHGWYRRGDVAAKLVMDPADLVTGQTALRLEPAAAKLDLVDLAVDVVQQAKAPITRGALEVEMQAKSGASRGRCRDAIDQAVARGRIVEIEGRRKARLYVLPTSPKGGELAKTEASDET
jgi:hypothetical protein